MSIYDSVEGYAQQLNMTVGQATEMVGSLKSIAGLMDKSRKCPLCFGNTLEFDSGEWETGTKAYVYCENGKVRSKDAEGNKFLDTCDFSDSDASKYLFTEAHDCDVILGTASFLDIRNEQAVRRELGQTWSECVDVTNADLKQLLRELSIKIELPRGQW